jgi:indole-3-glycerol phosphate synthase
MTTADIPDILLKIVEQKRADLPKLLQRRNEFEATAAQPTRRGFATQLSRFKPAIIAEVKQASPSKGMFTADFQPARTAQQYQLGGAACLSVLTDEKHFRGSWQDLYAARQAVSIPVLRKDFTIDEIHVWEAAAGGADAILLIAAILSESQMRHFRELAESFGMDALVEVHDAEELKPAVASGARLIGVNNRNLRTFEVRLETALDLAPLIPAQAVRVAESGIQSAADIALLQTAGYQAFLIGEHLMRSGDPTAALQQLCR